MQREDRFKQLFELSSKLVASFNINDILQSTIEGVTALTGLDTAALYLLVNDETLRLSNTTQPLPPDFPEEYRYAALVNHPHIRKSIETASPVFLPDVSKVLTMSPEESKLVALRNIKTLLFLPLVTETEVLGAMSIGALGTPKPISEEQRDLSHTLANVAALAVKNARLFEAKNIYARKLEQTLAEREKLQEQLLQAQKMEAIGQLAGGIAHDFNNMLSGIIGTAELMLFSLTDESMQENAKNIISIGMRSAELTSQLLAFARKSPAQKIPVDLHMLARDVESILRRTINRSIDIVADLDACKPVTIGDPAQIESALLNISLNARDAMPQGGTLTLGSSTKVIDECNCTVDSFELAPGTYTVLSVTDTGKGMDADIIEHIYEPFFTTKKPGEGTGLGLSAVYGTMKSHNGAVSVVSSPGRGTTFSLYFLSEEAGHAGAAFSDVAALPKTTQKTVPRHKIVVVDDEEIVGTIAAKLLKHAGYEVEVFTDGNAALKYLQVHHRSVSLVLLDIVMPKIDGTEFYRSLKTISSDLGVIIASGYSVDGAAQQMLSEGADLFLSKPFRQAALLNAVKTVLGDEHP